MSRETFVRSATLEAWEGMVQAVLDDMIESVLEIVDEKDRRKEDEGRLDLRRVCDVVIICNSEAW